MIVNRNLEAAWSCHNATKHSYASVHNNLHFLDWHNQLLPFKVYTELDPLPLPKEVRQTGVSALSAIAENIRPDRSSAPDLEALAQLYLAAYAQRLSATGLTFYDDEVTRFFSPHAHRKGVTMLVAIGENAGSLL